MNTTTNNAAPPRALRADARLSREKILKSARGFLDADGPDFALDHVAREAGVGNATLYRHFPSKATLLSALFHAETETLCERAFDLANSSDTEGALRTWLKTLVREVVRNAGLAVSLQGELGHVSDAESCYRLVSEATHKLVDNAVEDGHIRSGVTTSDILVVVNGIALALARTADADQAERLVEYFIDGITVAPDAD